MTNPLCIRRATTEDIPTISAVARVTWLAHYPGILSFQQIFYMLSRMYNAAQLEQEIEGGEIAFFLALMEGEAVGFCSAGPSDEPTAWKLHKLYVHPASQKQGVGRQLLLAAETEALRHSASTLILNVNKKNQKAIEAYRKYGFEKETEVTIDIGQGYVMDDFILRKSLSVPAPVPA